VCKTVNRYKKNTGIQTLNTQKNTINHHKNTSKTPKNTKKYKKIQKKHLKNTKKNTIFLLKNTIFLLKTPKNRRKSAICGGCCAAECHYVPGSRAGGRKIAKNGQNYYENGRKWRNLL
jgi:hypothetical protein